MNYSEFLKSKSQWGERHGFDPGELPTFLMDFQAYLVEWSIRQGRSAIFADCGLGKSPMSLVWADKVVRTTNRPVLFLTPIAVGQQMIREAEKFGVEAFRSRDGTMTENGSIWITNYEQLHKFEPSTFSGVVCDESSCIKDFKSVRKSVVTEFLRTVPYRLLCTATAAPNDYWELGTSSEALGLFGFRDMITRFFKQETSKDRLGWGRTKYRFRGHAEEPFWSWVCSWARSCRKPSDLGFEDNQFTLPRLVKLHHTIPSPIRDGFLFSQVAVGMKEEREERRLTIAERCEKAAEIANGHDGASTVWCNLNPEGSLLSKLITDCVEVNGSMPDDAKEEALVAFTEGNIKRIVTKPKIGAWGLNWQHCHNVVAFPSHSYEQMYQLVRRCYRFGQEHDVTVSYVLSEGEEGILENLKRKERQAGRMFDSIVKHMHDAMHLASKDHFPTKEELPVWV